MCVYIYFFFFTHHTVNVKTWSWKTIKLKRYSFISVCASIYSHLVLLLNLCVWLTCVPASCHPVQCAGSSPGASAYNPPACTKHPRVQSQVVVAMRTVKQQGNRAAATRFLRRLNISEWEDEAILWWYVCLPLSHSRFHLDVLLSNRQFGGGPDTPKEMYSALWILVACINNLSRGHFRKKTLALLCVFFTAKLWKQS